MKVMAGLADFWLRPPEGLWRIRQFGSWQALAGTKLARIGTRLNPPPPPAPEILLLASPNGSILLNARGWPEGFTAPVLRGYQRFSRWLVP